MISVNRGIPIAWLLASAWMAGQVLGAGASGGNREANSPLVAVNRDTIRTQDMNKLIIDFHNKMSNDHKSKFDYEKLLKKNVNDRLIVQEALAMDMDKDERVLKDLGTIRENLALSQYLSRNYKPSIKVSKEEISNAFHHYYGKMQIRSLAVPTEADANKRIGEIAKGASMDSLAKAYSLDTHKYDGGLHPLLHYADIEIILRDNAVKLKEGELSKPFAYRDVYAVIKLEKLIPADPKELPKFKEKIVGMLTDEKKQAAWEMFLVKIKARYPPIVNQANLLRIANDSARVLTADFLKGDSSTIIQISGGQRITDSIFRTRISRYVMSDGNLGFPKLVDKTLKSLSAEIALNAAVKAKGFLKNPAVDAAVIRNRDSCLIELYIQEMVVKNIKFNKKEFEDYYQQHLDDFRDPDQFKFSEILVASKDSADALVSRLNKGADFKFLSSQLSSGARLVSNGQEWVTLMILPDVIQAKLQGLKVGEHSGMLNTTEGWVIFNVEDRRKGKLKTMEEVDMKIRQVIFQKKFNQGLDTVMQTLKKNSTVTYYQDNIRNYFGKTN